MASEKDSGVINETLNSTCLAPYPFVMKSLIINVNGFNRATINAI